MACFLIGAAFAPAQAVTITTGCVSAVSCSIGELVDNSGTMQVNDKLFSNWTIGAATTDGFNLRKTEVNGLTNGGFDPGPGLFYDISFVGVSGVGTKTVAWGYDVTVLDPSLRIKDNSLGLAVFVGATVGFSSFRITEKLFDAANTPIGTKECTGDSTGGILEQDFVPPCDTLTFAPVSFLHVETELFLENTAADGTVFAEFVEQRYSQQVPEPGTLAMFAFGLAGLGFMRRRRLI